MIILTRPYKIFTALLILWVCSSCTAADSTHPAPSDIPISTNTVSQTAILEATPHQVPVAKEIQVQILPLSGPIADPKAEISGLAWHGDDLFLLPQFPERFQQSLFKLKKRDILDIVLGKAGGILEPEPVQLSNTKFLKQIKGFEGFEAITFHEDQIYLTIESKPREMLGYLVRGEISTTGNQVSLEPELIQIEPQAPIENYSDESILFFQGKIVTFYEANGANVNKNPVAHVFLPSGEPAGSIPFPNIEYRITDVTAPDQDGRFWAINYFFPLDQLKMNPAEDALATEYGRGPSHAQNRAVERLVEFQIHDQAVSLVNTAPIQLALSSDMVSRNWEGLAVLEGYGFLIATDKFPQTLFGFVPWESASP